jgi:hypothetical protein
MFKIEVVDIKLTNCMEQRPSWEAYSHSASQEIPRPLWNPRTPIFQPVAQRYTDWAIAALFVL